MDPERARRWDLVLPHHDRLYAVARRISGNPHDAEDCVQEAMARCVAFDRLDESNVVGFLVVTTTRLCADQHRRRQRDARLADKLAARVEHEPGPEEAVCDRAEARWIAERVTALPERQRVILQASAEGQSPAQIAAALSTSYKAVEGQLYRVRALARNILAGTYVLLAGLGRRPRFGTDASAVVAVASLSLVLATPPAGSATTHGADPVRPPEATVLVALPSPAPAPPVVATPRRHTAARPPTLPPSSMPPPMSCPIQKDDDVCWSPDPSSPPGLGLLDCVHYGVTTSGGRYCRPSPSPEPNGGTRP